ncbi:MAG TPA: FtsX-like permease family protein [Ohtaekwangia sp.]|nr:FtsX-like permease family protein [Ohtaekwangia sp.]
MVRSYLVLALRNFLRNKNYTLINLLGLSIGITSCLILFLVIRYDLNFDKFHTKYESIYRIVQESSSSSGTEFSSATPYPVIKGVRNDFPRIPLTTQVHFEGEGIIRIDESKFKIEDLLFADSLFFDVFDFETLSGNPREDLAEPGKAFVTPAVAQKIGYQEHTPLRVKINNLIEVEVVGLVQAPPATSHIQYSMIISMSSFTGDFIGGMPIDTWNLTSAGFSYVVLPESMSPETMEEQLKGFVKKYYTKNEGKERAYKLQQLKDIHFDERFTENPTNIANVSYSDLIVMGILGAFILVIACINFINLSTALAIKKSKEIGIRKTLGAKRSQLTVYFLGETFLLTLLSVLISLGLVEWILPWLNQFLEKRISLDLFGDPMLMLFILAMVLCTTVLSGFYPALILSGFNPVAVLKNKITAHGSTSAEVRKSACRIPVYDRAVFDHRYTSDCRPDGIF